MYQPEIPEAALVSSVRSQSLVLQAKAQTRNYKSLKSATWRQLGKALSYSTLIAADIASQCHWASQQFLAALLT